MKWGMKKGERVIYIGFWVMREKEGMLEFKKERYLEELETSKPLFWRGYSIKLGYRKEKKMQSKTASNLCINMWRKNKQRRVLCTVSIYKSLQYLFKFLLQYQITFPFSSIFSPSNSVYSLSLYTHICWERLILVESLEQLILTCWLSYVSFGLKIFYLLLDLITHSVR